MKKTIRLLATMAAVAVATPVVACEVEDWRTWHIPIMESLMIEGVTTCRTGEIFLRVYDGEGDDAKFVGVEHAYIEGYQFKTSISSVEREPEAVSIRFTFEEEE